MVDAYTSLTVENFAKRLRRGAKSESMANRTHDGGYHETFLRSKIVDFDLSVHNTITGFEFVLRNKGIKFVIDKDKYISVKSVSRKTGEEFDPVLQKIRKAVETRLIRDFEFIVEGLNYQFESSKNEELIDLSRSVYCFDQIEVLDYQSRTHRVSFKSLFESNTIRLVNNRFDNLETGLFQVKYLSISIPGYEKDLYSLHR